MSINPRKKVARLLKNAKKALKVKRPRNKEKYLKSQAGKMNANMTGCEETFMNLLIDLKIKFEPQKIVHGKIYDFYIESHNTLVEVDGNYWHGYGLQLEEMNDIQKRARKNDLYKDTLAKGLGFQIIRVWEHELEDEYYNETKKKIKNLFF